MATATIGLEQLDTRERALGALLVGRSGEARELHSAVLRAASCDAPVVVRGEPGSGREWIARIVHSLSARCRQPFVSLCAALPEELSSLRTLRAATGGAVSAGVYLKEVDRVAPEPTWPDWADGESYALWPARPDASNVPALGRSTYAESMPSLRWMVGASMPLAGDGDSRGQSGCEDGWIELCVPPLRSRVEDILPLAEHFLEQSALRLSTNPLRLDESAVTRLTAYRWPGNVAELREVVRRAALRARQRGRSVIEPEDLEGLAAEAPLSDRLRALSFEELVRIKVSDYLSQLRGYAVESLYAHVLQRVERPLLETVMESTGGNQLRAAELLGINRNTLRKKLGELCASRGAPTVPARNSP